MQLHGECPSAEHLQPAGQPMHFAPAFFALMIYATAAPMMSSTIPKTMISAIFPLLGLLCIHTFMLHYVTYSYTLSALICIQLILCAELLIGSLDQHADDCHDRNDYDHAGYEACAQCSGCDERTDLIYEECNGVACRKL